MRNIELLQKTMQYIKDHPTTHDQRVWANPTHCGTTACFFGWAAMLSGWNAMEVEACEKPALYIGKEILGLTFEESKALYYGGNSINDLELIVKDLVDGNPIRNVGQEDDNWDAIGTALLGETSSNKTSPCKTQGHNTEGEHIK